VKLVEATNYTEYADGKGSRTTRMSARLDGQRDKTDSKGKAFNTISNKQKRNNNTINHNMWHVVSIQCEL
jgi:hypothetical protein